jgi:uncharacterized protein (TIGR02444 family)
LLFPLDFTPSTIAYWGHYWKPVFEDMMDQEQKEKAWDWIVGFYSKPPVKSACLVFQDRNGVDVTFLLFLCWLDKNKLQLTKHYLTCLQDHDRARKKIRFTRKIRRFASTFSFAENYKKSLLAKELVMEKKFFFALCDHQTEKAKTPVLAKNYITYKGAIPSAAASVFLKWLKA